jgi:hypothetical protein
MWMIWWMLGLALGRLAECTQDLLYRCESDINKGIAECQQAEEAKGRDPDPDLECVKYLIDLDRDCWPCICKFAEARHLKVRGCPHS